MKQQKLCIIKASHLLMNSQTASMHTSNAFKQKGAGAEMRQLASIYLFLWASSYLFKIVFRKVLSISTITAFIFWVLLISNKGLSSRINRSASFPAATVPNSFSLYKNLAGLIVAV